MTWADDILEIVKKDVDYQGDRILRYAKASVARAAQREAGQLFTWLASLIGSKMTSAPKQLGVKWKDLSDKQGKRGKTYRQRKIDKYGSQAFFLGIPDNSGEPTLQEVFQRANPREVFGAVEDEDHHRNPLASTRFSRLPGGRFNITVTLYPNLSETSDDGGLAHLIADHTEDRVAYKLLNHGHPGGPIRSFVYPAIVFFAQTRVRARVEQTLMAQGFILR